MNQTNHSKITKTSENIGSYIELLVEYGNEDEDIFPNPETEIQYQGEFDNIDNFYLNWKFIVLEIVLNQQAGEENHTEIINPNWSLHLFQRRKQLPEGSIGLVLKVM